MKHGIFLGKNMSNDMYVASVSGNLRLSRSIKSIFPVWSDHIEEYRQVSNFPWQADASFGNKIEPVSKRDLTGAGIPLAVPALDDEAASDPEDSDVGGAGIIKMTPPLTL